MTRAERIADLLNTIRVWQRENGNSPIDNAILDMLEEVAYLLKEPFNNAE